MAINKAEKRDNRLALEVEITLYALITCVVQEENVSYANYVRSCIIQDLDKRGLLTKEALLRIAS